MAVLRPAPVFGETAKEAHARADAEQERLDGLLGQLDVCHAEVDTLNAQIDDLADQTMVLQGALIEDRAHLAEMVSMTYRWGGSANLLSLLLSSRGIEDFISNLYYAKKVTEWEARCVEDVLTDKNEIELQMNRIEQTRAERREALATLEEACAEVSASVESLQAWAATLDAEERAAEEKRLEEAARQAEAERKYLEEDEAKKASEADARAQTENHEKSSSQESAGGADSQVSSSQQGQAQEPERAAEDEAPAEDAAAGEAEDGGSEGADAAGDWITCRASAYTIADNTPPGSTSTASGIPLDDTVPSVALPMSIGPARFYGSKIQIEYNGMTVIATVTDCGGLYGRGLDLSTAVFRAFGFQTADAWGVRTVRYRFL